ncbi:MAG: hypothetical protein ABI669_10140 [Usitatibacter sp.]
MKRAVLMALGIGAVLTSAAAFSIGGAPAANTQFTIDNGPMGVAHSERRAREAQRASIEERYLGNRALCAPLGGLQRDQCLIDAHATRGRALLAAAAPYESRMRESP